MALCVFDLDNTLGDFRLIDYFGLLLEPKILPNYYKDDKITQYKYTKEEKDLLLRLRDKIEKEIEKKGYNNKILRPKLKEILNPLVEQYKKHKIKGFIIYSNNANLYSLEYAGRAIQNMFNIPDLFIKYLDRNHEERKKFDKLDSSGYPSKMVDTIKQYTTGTHPILFVDDMIHNDFYIDYENVTYIIIPPFESDANKIDLQIIISLFEDIFEDMETFFNLYHIKNILKIHNFEELKNQYLLYSSERKPPSVFKENLPMIEKKINSFIKKISTSGGLRKRKRTRKNNKRVTKKR